MFYNPMGPYSGGNPGAVGNAWTAGLPNVIGGGQNWMRGPSGMAGGGGILPNGQRIGGMAGGIPGTPGYGQQPATGPSGSQIFNWQSPGGSALPGHGGIGPNGQFIQGMVGSQPGQYGQVLPPLPNTSGGAATAGQPGIGGLTTSVQPQGVFSPQQTQYGVNQALASAAQQADPRFQQKQFMTPGRSLDAGTMSAAIPGMAQALNQGQQQAAQIPLMDAFANQQNLLNGQIGQQQESNGLSNALAQFNENNIYQQNQMLNPLMQMLMGGGGFGMGGY